jgi:2,3-bisphosphoglycerate-dependent phosphoglycerate mutase
MDLLLIRHAEPIRIVDAAGPADPPLRDRGHLQAERLAKWLADERLDAIVSSPMVRARETAAPVAAAHGLDVIIDDDLAEFDRDANSYIPYEEMKASKDPRFLAMVEGNLEDFETDPLEFQAAVVAAIERVIEAYPSRTVAVVCHGGVINAYTAHVAGISKVMWFETQYASISRVVASSRPGGPRSIVTLNETPHLRGTGLLPS